MLSPDSIPQIIPQYCGIGSPRWRNSHYPAIFPAILRDSRSSGDSFRKQAISPFLSPKWRETNKILLKILEEIGV